MADDSMEEISLTEDEMLAQAIALSLDKSPPPSEATQHPSSLTTHTPAAPMRSNTMQSTDSALTEASFNEPSRQMSHLGTASTSSSPDLGISGGETEMEQSRTEPGECSKATGANRSAHQQSGVQLPFARLSSLHDQGRTPDSDESKGSSLGMDWKPNKECLELIVGMGISENAAKRALFYTGNDNAELAVAWVFENISNPQLHEPFEPPSMISLAAQGGQISPGPVYHSFDELLQETIANTESYKMVFVVNTELKMSTGKIAAQVGHATLGLYRFLQDHQEYKTGLASWEKRGCKKVVVKGDNVRQLLDLKKRAYELHIANIMVHDAGRTQVEPGSLTVFAVFGKDDQVDPLTGKLKLL